MKLSAFLLSLLLISGCSADATTDVCEGEDCEDDKLPFGPRERDGGGGGRVRLGDSGGEDEPDGGAGETDAQEPMDEPDAAAEDDAQVLQPDGGAEPDAEVQEDSGETDAAEPPAGAGPCEICDVDACAPGLLCLNLPGDSSHTRRCFPACGNAEDDQAECTSTFGAGGFQCWADGACSPVFENQSPYWFDQNCDLYLGN